MPRGSCRNASARSARAPVSTVRAKGRPLSAWKNVRNVPPAGTVTPSRSFWVPDASGADVMTVVTSRNAGPASVSSVQPVTVPTEAPGAANPRRASLSCTVVRRAAQPDRRRRGDPGSVAPERVAGRCRAGGTPKLEALHGVRRGADRTHHRAVGVAGPDGMHLDIRHGPGGLQPAIGPVDIGETGPLVHDGAAWHRLGGDHERLTDVSAGIGFPSPGRSRRRSSATRPAA